MSPVIKVLCAGMIAFTAGSHHASATDLSPGYVGADFGAPANEGRSGISSRVYAGYNLGTTVDFGYDQVHAIELMAFSVGSKSKNYLPTPTDHDRVRADGLGINWAGALKINDAWTLTNRLGVTYTRATSYASNGYSTSYGSWSPMASVGMGYALNRKVSLTADLSYMPIKLDSEIKLNTMLPTAGLSYHF